MKTATAHIDGSGNSGHTEACAAVLRVQGECHIRTRVLPPGTTNNVGEYSGLLLAIDLARELGVEALHVLSDSQLIVHQVSGKWKCKDHRLQELRLLALRNATGMKLTIQWIPREENIEADALCRRVISAANQFPKNPFLKPKSLEVTYSPNAFRFMMNSIGFD